MSVCVIAGFNCLGFLAFIHESTVSQVEYCPPIAIFSGIGNTFKATLLNGGSENVLLLSHTFGQIYALHIL